MTRTNILEASVGRLNRAKSGSGTVFQDSKAENLRSLQVTTGVDATIAVQATEKETETAPANLPASAPQFKTSVSRRDVQRKKEPCTSIQTRPFRWS